jgi:predicted AlkP superfamily phosphohydrolase/phosphomutase
MTRAKRLCRFFGTLGAFVVIAAAVTPNASAKAADEPNVVVVGIDGMDPKLLRKFMAKGRMPNFERLIDNGSFSELTTSIPPQSPVAWSNFITGMNPGGHGIFDFIHQDRSAYLPVFSSAVVEAPSRTWTVGKWVIPLSQGRVELLRKGEAFWQTLDQKEVPYLVFRIPANFPPAESKGTSVSGMGTPDILGTYGTFSFYTNDPTLMGLDVSGGEVFPVELRGDRIEAAFKGPENTMLVGAPHMMRPMTIDLDKDNQTARITVDDEVVILEEGEWSDWFQVSFDVMGPFNKLGGITRLYLKSVAPYFQLYATPIQIDPSNPALPISNNDSFAKHMYEKIGFHYTQGMAEDTKALEWGIFTDAEFIKQSGFVFEERIDMLDAVLDDYAGGFLFFYFSSIDLTCHMQWRNMDPNHPGHTPEGAKYKDHIENLYARMDSVVGNVHKRIPEGTTLIVMSDHGFAPYYKKVNLNSLLYESGFLELRRPNQIGQQPLFRNVFWRRTRAFGLGINGLYVNLRGREAQGVVKEGAEYEAVLAEVTEKLLAYRDPDTGEQVVKTVYRASEVYSGPHADNAPDLIVGYANGYRGSDDNALGQLHKQTIVPNMDKWSGTHCMALDIVPGILVTNREITVSDPALTDLAPSILAMYGLKSPEDAVVGRNIFDEKSRAQAGQR